MWWRSSHSEFVKNKGEKNKNALKEIVNSGQTPGILAYSNGIPIGWCSVSPRKTYPRLERSRILKQIDDNPVWSIVCFFIKKEYRRKGLSLALLKAALNYIKKQGGTIAEGYPIDPKNKKYADAFAYTGLISPFRKAGFTGIPSSLPRHPARVRMGSNSRLRPLSGGTGTMQSKAFPVDCWGSAISLR